MRGIEGRTGGKARKRVMISSRAPRQIGLTILGGELFEDLFGGKADDFQGPSDAECNASNCEISARTLVSFEKTSSVKGGCKEATVEHESGKKLVPAEICMEFSNMVTNSNPCNSPPTE